MHANARMRALAVDNLDSPAPSAILNGHTPHTTTSYAVLASKEKPRTAGLFFRGRTPRECRLSCW